uniref:Uncharacterized protein n=1 Tax=Rhizophora mucronata TaxID=61149 RepID=A0A2P2N8L1_RHIMU
MGGHTDAITSIATSNLQAYVEIKSSSTSLFIYHSDL